MSLRIFIFQDKFEKFVFFFLGNRPNDGWQYYCDRCSMKKYARLVNIHNQLHDYLDFLMEGKQKKSFQIFMIHNF